MPIQKVGIRNIRYPITVRDKSRETQQTVANVTLSVNLPHTNRGTHMSRFVEVLDRFKNEVSYQSLDLILIEIKKALKAEESHIELAFPFFLRKKAPVSGLESLMSYDCVIEATYANHLEIATRVEVPVHTLCPCSKEISDYLRAQPAGNGVHHGRHDEVHLDRGPHPDRGGLRVQPAVRPAEAGGREVHHRARLRESRGSSRTSCARSRSACRRSPALRYQVIEAENFESIHNHSAYAVIAKRADADRVQRGHPADPQGPGLPSLRHAGEAVSRSLP